MLDAALAAALVKAMAITYLRKRYSWLYQHGPSPTLPSPSRRGGSATCRGNRWTTSRPRTSEHRVDDPHSWWFGFSCDQIYDVVPADAHRPARFLQAEVGAVYRDDGYVVRQTIVLAAQLRAIADGRAAPPRDGPPPPIGLDPRQGGGRG